MLKVSVVRVMPVVVLAAVCGIVGGAWVATQRAEVRLAAADARLDALELSVQHRLAPPSAGTSGTALASGTREREALVQSVVSRVQREVGLLPVKLVRERRASFVELYATDSEDASNYGTAGYLGDGYFLTVKHGVMALDEGRRITSVKLRLGDRTVPATVVDYGDAKNEVDPGDWAILKVEVPVTLPPLRPDLDYDVRLRRCHRPHGQRLLEGHHRGDRLRRAEEPGAGDVSDRRAPGGVGRRRAEPAR